MKNYYKILEIEINSTNEVIKKSYRIMALRYHPDKNNDPNAHHLFLEISEAYEILIDPIKRKLYDSLFNQNSAVIKLRNHEKQMYDFEEFVKDSKKKAQVYSKTKLENLFDHLGNFVGATVNATINVTSLIFGCVFFFGGIGGFYNWANRLMTKGLLYKSDYISGPLITIGFTFVGFFFFKGMYDEYKNK